MLMVVTQAQPMNNAPKFGMPMSQLQVPKVSNQVIPYQESLQCFQEEKSLVQANKLYGLNPGQGPAHRLKDSPQYRSHTKHISLDSQIYRSNYPHFHGHMHSTLKHLFSYIYYDLCGGEGEKMKGIEQNLLALKNKQQPRTDTSSR